MYHSSRCLLCDELTVTEQAFEFRFQDYTARKRRCLGCGLVRVDPVPNERQLRAAYYSYCDSIVQPGAHMVGYESDPIALRLKARWALSRIVSAKAQGATVLELGCSSGFFLRLLADRGYRCFGLDIDEHAVRLAKSKGLKVFLGSIDSARTHFAGESFDVVYMSHLLEHTRDAMRVLRQVAELLRPDGLLILEGPLGRNPTLQGMLMSLIHRLRPPGAGARLSGFPYHLWEFNRRNLVSLLEASGFYPTELTVYDTGPNKLDIAVDGGGQNRSIRLVIFLLMTISFAFSRCLIGRWLRMGRLIRLVCKRRRSAVLSCDRIQENTDLRHLHVEAGNIEGRREAR